MLLLPTKPDDVSNLEKTHDISIATISHSQETVI
jgi:hypothetical protein